jgi:hypothetical protein
LILQAHRAFPLQAFCIVPKSISYAIDACKAQGWDVDGIDVDSTQQTELDPVRMGTDHRSPRDVCIIPSSGTAAT